MNNFDYKYMTPFKWFVLENFPFIENDFEAINNYRLFSKVVEYLNKMKDNVNLTGQQMENLTNAMIELQNYVDNYFSELNIQDEINNKLDEMALDGTLAEIINEEIFETLNNKIDNLEFEQNAKLKYYLMPVNNLSELSSGDCHVLVTPNDKVIMIDTGYTPAWDLIKARLNQLNITKIDYLIISHYHGDHVANLELLKANFDMTETIYYLPPFSNHQDVQQYYQWVQNLIGDNEKIIPNENQVITIDNVNIKFFNIGSDDYNYYDSISADYNQYSMCCIVNYKDINMLFTGDIGLQAEERIYSKGSIDVNIDFYKVEHHATNLGSASNYLKTLNNPKVAVISCNNQNFIMSATQYQNFGSLKINTMSYLSRNGCKIYCATNNNNFSYETDGKSYNIPNNNNYAQFNSNERNNFLSSTNKMIEIYVDNSYNGQICDGTELRPYKTIQEAIVNGIVEGCHNLIIVKNGDYAETNLVISGISSHVVIQGESKENTLIKNIYISNCKALCIKDCTFYDTKDNALIIGSFSNVELNNVLINGQTAQTLQRGVALYDSKVKMSNCEISNKSIAISLTGMSEIYTENLSGTNNEYIFNTASQSIVRETNNTIAYSEYMFYRLLGAFLSPKSNVDTTTMTKMIAGGNAFNALFYNRTVNKYVVYIGGVWKDLMGNNIN